MDRNKPNVNPILPKWWSHLQTPKSKFCSWGRLTHFLPQWEEVTSDPWTDLEFCHPPPPSTVPINFPSPLVRDKRLALHGSRSAYHAKERDNSPNTEGFNSRLFLVNTKTGGFRPMIDLSSLSKFIISPYFKMETSRSIIRSMIKNIWATSIYLKDVHFHIAMEKSVQT